MYGYRKICEFKNIDINFKILNQTIHIVHKIKVMNSLFLCKIYKILKLITSNALMCILCQLFSIFLSEKLLTANNICLCLSNLQLSTCKAGTGPLRK